VPTPFTHRGPLRVLCEVLAKNCMLAAICWHFSSNALIKYRAATLFCFSKMGFKRSVVLGSHSSGRDEKEAKGYLCDKYFYVLQRPLSIKYLKI